MTALSNDVARWTVIVPVKLTSLAKSRLVDIDAKTRQRLAVAFAIDTVRAALACPVVDEVVVVTSDPIGERFSAMGATVVADVPDAGLNPALSYAANHIRAARPHAAVAAISSDLPSLRPVDLARALNVDNAQRWFVSDADGSGTTLIAATGDAEWTPRFGPGSRTAHAAAGMTDLATDGLERLRRDVDTPHDLGVARGYGVGAETTRVLAELDALR